MKEVIFSQLQLFFICLIKSNALVPPVQEASVQLVTVQGHAPRPGQQLLIDYGDKTNEELLFYYGACAALAVF